MLAPSDFSNPTYYINRELSWLSFNERVLEEALDDRNPLFERLNFLAITSSNLDEFFMVRIAGLKDQSKSGNTYKDNKTQLSSVEQWHAAISKSRDFMRQQENVWKSVLVPLLQDHGIEFACSETLTDEQSTYLTQLFHDMIYPVLTPMAVDASRPFPMLFNRTLNLAVLLDVETLNTDEHVFAFVQVPSVLPRFVELPSPGHYRTYILLEDIIRMHLSELFRGKRILAASAFRITRNADLTLNEDDAEDLLEEIERELSKRRTGDAVRIEVERGMHPFLRHVLEEWEEISPEEWFDLEGPLDLTFLFRFVNQDGFESLRFPELSPISRLEDQEGNHLFEAIKRKDVLLYHPFESFEPIIRFIRQAAQDPNVLAIKQTLYRVGKNSPIVAALAKAAETGKQVTVLVELRARFDEEKNIVWAKKLETAGCHVIYGLVGLKTHTKMTLVVRLEKNRIQRYVHLGTGNYNENTARLYTDFGLFTANEDIAEDVSNIFNQLSGYSSLPQLHHLKVAPWGLEKAFLALLHEVTAESTQTNPGRVIAKMNALTDKEIIQALYRASSSGVQIDLIVRGICCLRPGIPGVSENIRVHSIVGRFLEHGRAYYFKSPEREQVFLSSADWMTRNLKRRVETLFPVLDEDLKELVIQTLLLQLADNTKRRVLQSDGSYVHAINDERQETLNSQERMQPLLFARS